MSHYCGHFQMKPIWWEAQKKEQSGLCQDNNVPLQYVCYCLRKADNACKLTELQFSAGCRILMSSLQVFDFNKQLVKCQWHFEYKQNEHRNENIGSVAS